MKKKLYNKGDTERPKISWPYKNMSIFEEAEKLCKAEGRVTITVKELKDFINERSKMGSKKHRLS